MAIKDNIDIRIDDESARRMLREKKHKAENWQPAARLIHRQMQVNADSMFVRNRRGGRHRGVTWKPFADQYTRITDGATVPAEGGVRRLRGSGQVLGRLRPSGTRVTSSSGLLQDTGTLRSRALISRRITKTKLVMSSGNVRYARRQHDMRPWAFFHLPNDMRMMQRILLRHLLSG